MLNSLLHTFIFAKSVIDVTPLPNHGSSGVGSSEIKTALSIVFSITGAIALLIIVIAGVRYITSEGDPQAVAQAKGAIIYAAVGLAVSILAISIVDFVIGKVG